MESQSETTQTVSALKLPVLKTGDYDLWRMRMEQYLTHTDYALWELARKNELKAKSTLLLAIPDEHLLKFHGIKDAKTLWEAIKARFGGNKESKKMQKTILKQQYENFAASRSEGLDKTYDRPIKPNSQNVAFVSSENTSSTNEAVNTAQEVSTASLQGQASSSTYADDVMFSFFANQSNSPQLDNEDLEQIDTGDLEEMDLKWQAEEGITNFALMAYTSQGSSSSDSELEEALKEKDDLKLKLEKFEESSKNLTKLINSQISAKDKAGLGYDSQINENDVVHSVFNSRESDADDSPVNDRFKTGEGFHVVPPPYTRNYMPSRPELSFVGLDDSVYKPKVSETKTIISKTSKDIIEKPKTVRPSAPIIEDWDTKSNNNSVFRPKTDQTKPKFTKINFVKSDENTKSVNKENTHKQVEYPRKSQSPRGNRRNWNGMMTQKLWNGFEFIKKACFVCGSFNHLIKDCDFKDKKMGNPQYTLQDQRIFDSGCSRHMTGNKSFLTDYQEVDGGFVAFAGSPKGGKITGKGKIRTGKLDFEDVYFVKELKFNLFSVSQMCDKKNSVLFTETECLVLSPDFKLLDESQVLLKVPRQNNMYSFDLKNVVPSGGLTCLFAKATIDESNLWHRRLGHINFKTMNKLVKGNLVRGLPLKLFENNHTCVACQKGKQHKASCKTKLVSSINQPLQMLHMDLFGPKTARSINHKIYCLVVTDDYSRFSWVFFLATTDETSGILKTFIIGIENQINHKAEAVSTACYVQNRVLVTKPYNKAPYELLHGRPPTISFMRPFGCPVTILNTLDPLGKFDGKADEGFFVGYSINSKAFRVFNTRTRKVEENLHITFLENKPNVAGSGPDWLFDIDLLTNSMNYEPVTAGNQTNKNVEDAVADDAGKKTNEKTTNKGERNGQEKEEGASNKEDDQNMQDFRAELDNLLVQQKQGYANSTNRVFTVSPSVSATGESFTNVNDLPTDHLLPDLEDTTDLLNTGIFSGAYDDEDEGPEADLNNLETTMNCLLYDTIEEEVYVCQPPGFEDPQFPDKVYKVEKALYGLHQAHRAWYETLSTYLLENGFRRGIIDKTLFIKKDKEFESLMHKKFQMSSMGELTFFLGLQVMQRDDGIFIGQDKYVADILKKFYFVIMKATSTLIETNKALLKDEEAKDVDVHLYRSIIGSLMNLTAFRPDIMFAVCACARFQVTPKVSHLYAVKRIFRYLKGQPKLGLWYLRDSSFNLEAFSDSDYAVASLDRKSTTGVMYEGRVNQDGDGKESIIKAKWKAKRATDISQSSRPIPLVTDETVIKEWEDRMERAVTTTSSLEVEQDSGNINRTQSMATLNESFPQGTDSGSGPRCQYTILRGVEAQTRFEAASK
ncbi:putative ribonuclease H-like domain-containing protein [Tanacetum coccineum]